MKKKEKVQGSYKAKLKDRDLMKKSRIVEGPKIWFCLKITTSQIGMNFFKQLGQIINS